MIDWIPKLEGVVIFNIILQFEKFMNMQYACPYDENRHTFQKLLISLQRNEIKK